MLILIKGQREEDMDTDNFSMEIEKRGNIMKTLMEVENKSGMVINKMMMRIQIKENNMKKISPINQTKRNTQSSLQTNDSQIIRIKGIKLNNNIRKMIDKNKKDFKIKNYSSIRRKINKMIKKLNLIKNLILLDLRLSNA